MKCGGDNGVLGWHLEFRHTAGTKIITHPWEICDKRFEILKRK